MQTITVDVTAEDIKQGQKCLNDGTWRTETCAIAVALRRIFPEANRVSWGYAKGSVDTLELEAVDRELVRSFVSRHDQGLDVAPFHFDAVLLRLPINQDFSFNK